MQDVVISGAGPAGLAAAAALVNHGMQVTLVSPNGPPDSSDTRQDLRTTALLSGSVEILRSIGLWETLSATASPLKVIRIIDATDRLFRTPQVDFKSSEIGLDAFGYNVTNQDLISNCWRHLEGNPKVSFVKAGVLAVDDTGNHVNIVLDNGEEIETSFLIGADGRNSPTRTAITNQLRNWSYPQHAMVTSLSHKLPHHNISTEFHTRSGPFTLVPLPTNRSSLVWVTNETECERVKDTPSLELPRLIEDKMQSILGKVSIESPVQTFPLSSMISDCFGKGRIALVGEAGHVMPPIGAQGFNLGLRDVNVIAQLLSSLDPRHWADAGDAYHSKRTADIHTRVGSVDMLNRSLLSDFYPMQLARSGGLLTLNAIAPLRKYLMKQGVGEAGAQPSSR